MQDEMDLQQPNNSNLLDYVNAAGALLETLQGLADYSNQELSTIAFKLGTRQCRSGWVMTQYALLGFSQELAKGKTLPQCLTTMRNRAAYARLGRQLADPNYKHGR